MRALVALLVVTGCARAGYGSEDAQPGGAADARATTDGGTAGDAAGSHDASGNVDAGVSVDAGGGNIDAGGGSIDAGGGNIDAGGGSSAAQLTQYASRSCWSWGGFGTVRPDAPAHVIGFLEDADGIADIVMSAEVIILGSTGQHSLGQKALLPWGDTGCCQRGTKVQIDYGDFIAAAQVIDTSGRWGARVIYRDHGGHTTAASCEGAAGWYVNSTPLDP